MVNRAPDVKRLVMDHLAAIIAVPVLGKRLDDGTDSYAVVIATGGAGRRDRFLQSVQLTIDSYGPSSGMAFALANEIDGIMHSLPASQAPIIKTTGFTASYFPDPVSEQDRYTATYQLLVKTR